LTGWGGAISLGQFAIVGMGAVLTGNLLNRTGLDLFVILLLAGVTGGAVALLVGLPALRIKGLFLAVTTLAFAVALDSYFLSTTNFPGEIPGRVQRPILWQRWRLDGGTPMYYLTLAFLVLTLLTAYGVRKGRSGRGLVATKDNERAAAASALPVTSLKLTGFLFSGVIAGVAGGLYVLVVRGVGNGSFQPSMSLEVFST